MMTMLAHWTQDGEAKEAIITQQTVDGVPIMPGIGDIVVVNRLRLEVIRRVWFYDEFRPHFPEFHYADEISIDCQLVGKDDRWE